MPPGYSSFASAVSPFGMAFDASGDLFVDSFVNGTITEYSHLGGQSTFASGLSHPEGLAFDASGNLYEVDNGSGNIYEFTSTGSKSTFASGLGTGLAGPHFVAFESPASPEPSTAALAGIGLAALWVVHRRRKPVT